MLLTATERLTMNTRPKNPANARNLNFCGIGSSGSGKTRFWLTPQLLQAHSSYVVVDPKGGVLGQVGSFLQKRGYKIKVFNSIDFLKSIFKTACAILILSNTFNIVMAVFDVSQSVIARAAGIVQGSTDISEAMLADLEATLETLGLGSLLGLWLQSLLIHVTMWAINVVIFVIVYGRMIEIYLLTSLAPIPVATLSNRELGNTGQNYLKSLFAVGFQGLLILVCVAIYAVLIQGIATSGDPIGAIWDCMGYSVLLCFCLFKTGTIARSIFGAH